MQGFSVLHFESQLKGVQKKVYLNLSDKEMQYTHRKVSKTTIFLFKTLLEKSQEDKMMSFKTQMHPV